MLHNGWIVTIALMLALGPTGASIAIGILDPEVRDVDALMGGTVGLGRGRRHRHRRSTWCWSRRSTATLGDRLDERDATCCCS